MNRLNEAKPVTFSILPFWTLLMDFSFLFGQYMYKDFGVSKQLEQKYYIL
jgi:hypothetical protein